MKNAQIHRFHERAALALPGNGATVYLTVKEARWIARELNRCARDIAARGFIASGYGTAEHSIAHPFAPHAETMQADRARRAQAVQS